MQNPCEHPTPRLIRIAPRRHFGSAELRSMHRLRARVFKERMGWDVPILGGMEIDGYDTLDPYYMLIRDTGNDVLGCWRLLPTEGPYMLKDTFPELLRGQAVPESEKIWELSRFAIETEGAGRFGFADLALDAMREIVFFGDRMGIERYVTVTTTAIERLLLRTGIAACRLGPPMRIGAAQAVALDIDLGDQTHAALFGRNAPGRMQRDYDGRVRKCRRTEHPEQNDSLKEAAMTKPHPEHEVPADSKTEDDPPPKASPAGGRMRRITAYAVPALALLAVALSVTALVENETTGKHATAGLTSRMDGLDASLTASRNEVAELKSALAQANATLQAERKKRDGQMIEVIQSVSDMQARMKIFPRLEDMLYIPAPSATPASGAAAIPETPVDPIQALQEAIGKLNKKK